MMVRIQNSFHWRRETRIRIICRGATKFYLGILARLSSNFPTNSLLKLIRNPHAESQEVEKLATLTNIFSLRSLLSSQIWIGMQLAANRDSGTQAPSSSGLCYVSHMAFPGPCACLSLSSSPSHGETQVHMWDVFMGQMWQWHSLVFH